MSSKKNKIINILLIVFYILTIGVIIFLTKSNVFKKKTVEDTGPIIPNSSYEKVKVSDLESKIKRFSFAIKKQDYIREGTTTLNSSISGGKVTISIKMGNIKKEYTVDDIEDANSIGSYLITKDGGKHISYITTNEGKIYKIEDSLTELKEKEDYKGVPKDMGLTNVTSISVDHKLTNSLLEDKTKVKPFVYIKTDDERFFTDESFIDGKDIVEVIELKEEKEETKEEKKEENASKES